MNILYKLLDYHGLQNDQLHINEDPDVGGFHWGTQSNMYHWKHIINKAAHIKNL